MALLAKRQGLRRSRKVNRDEFPNRNFSQFDRMGREPHDPATITGVAIPLASIRPRACGLPALRCDSGRSNRGITHRIACALRRCD
jgi:hypothetical protein